MILWCRDLLVWRFGDLEVWQSVSIVGFCWGEEAHFWLLGGFSSYPPSKENPVTNTKCFYHLSNCYVIEIWYTAIHYTIVSKTRNLALFDEYELVIEKKLNDNGPRIEL